jgi:hypothetical protein
MCVICVYVCYMCVIRVYVCVCVCMYVYLDVVCAALVDLPKHTLLTIHIQLRTVALVVQIVQISFDSKD